MTRRGVLAAVALLALSAAMLAVVPPPAASASCVGPAIAIGADPAAADAAVPQAQRSGALPARGEAVVVSGQGFAAECRDTYDGGGCAPAPGPAPGQQDVALVLTQDGRTWQLGRADAAPGQQRNAVTWRVRVPADAHSGPAVLQAGTATLAVQVAGG